MSLAARWALTAIATIVVLAMAQVPLPGIDAEAARGAGLAVPSMSLGLLPLMSAMLLVEIAALLVPRFRSLRHGSPDGRARLVRWSTRLALAVAAFQGFGMKTWLDRLRPDGLYQGGMGAGLLVIFTLVASTAFQIWIARSIDRLRTVNGLVLLVIAGAAMEMSTDVLRALGMGPGIIAASPAALAHGDAFSRNVLAALATIVATATLLRKGPHHRLIVADGKAPREAPPLALPASSTMPINYLVLPATLASLHITGAASLATAFEGDFSLPAIVFVAIVGAITTLVLHRPGALGALYARLEERPTAKRTAAWREASARSIRGALAPTLVYLLVLTVVAKQASFAVLGMALLVALCFDIHESLRAERVLGENVVVWEDLRGAALPVARTALAREGIASEVVGANVLALLQVVSPYALASVRVSIADEPRARALLGALLGPLPKESDAGSSSREEETAP